MGGRLVTLRLRDSQCLCCLSAEEKHNKWPLNTLLSIPHWLNSWWTLSFVRVLHKNVLGTPNSICDSTWFHLFYIFFIPKAKMSGFTEKKKIIPFYCNFNTNHFRNIQHNLWSAKLWSRKLKSMHVAHGRADNSPKMSFSERITPSLVWEPRRNLRLSHIERAIINIIGVARAKQTLYGVGMCVVWWTPILHLENQWPSHSLLLPFLYQTKIKNTEKNFPRGAWPTFLHDFYAVLHGSGVCWRDLL